MIHPELKYVDFAIGDPMNRNNVVTLAEVAAAEKDGEPMYRTWCRYSKAYQDYALSHQKNGKPSVAGYEGIHYADILPFDFDNEDLEEAQSQARTFVTKLEVDHGVSPDSLLFWFSGSKGFHIGMSAALFGGFEASERLYVQLGRLAALLAGDVPYDDGLYQRNRMLRMENTVNMKSGLYKIRLTSVEFLMLTVNETKALAHGTRPSERIDLDLDFIHSLESLKLKAQREPSKEERATVDVSNLFGGHVDEGARDNTAFKIACYLRNAGLKAAVALRILGWWDATNPVPLTETDGETVLEDKIASAYAGEETQEDRITDASVLTVVERAEVYAEYVKSLQERCIHLGVPSLDNRIRGIGPGEVMVLLARSGVGKSAIVQNILRHASRMQKVWSLFLSLEQPIAQCFEREAQIANSERHLRGREIEAMWIDEPDEAVVRAVTEDYERCLVCDMSSVRLDEVPELMQIAEQKADGRISLLAVDYLGYLDSRGMGHSIYERVSEVARELKVLAKRLDVAVICLAQVSRNAGGDGSEPLTINAARESGVIEESADFLIGAHRPNMREGVEDDTITLAVLKNRKGAEGVPVECHFDRITLKITEKAAQGGTDESH